MEMVAVSKEELKVLISEAVREHLTPHNPQPKEVVQSERLNIDEALKFLNDNGCPTSRGKLYHLTSKGKIPFWKYGIKLVFYREELLKWIEEQVLKVG